MEVISHANSQSDSHPEAGQSLKEQEITLGVENIRARCATDLDLFSALLLLGLDELVEFPPYYHMLWRLFTTLEVDTSKVFRFALGLPRGHAKTTFIKLLICWLVLYHRAHFILMVCSTEPHSYNMMDDVDYMLGGINVRRIWGNWKSGLVRDTKGLKRGKFNGQEIVLAALGAGTSVRGLNILNTRPDVIIMDDVQTKECAKSDTENQALLEWIIGTLLKCRDMSSALLVYIGNMYNEACVLNQLKLHPDWQSFITGAILADWTPLWPAKFTLEQLLSEYKHDNALGLGDIWFSEVMNIPVGGKLSLLPDGKLPESTIVSELDDPIGAFILIDPSGYRKDSDDTAIACHKIYAPNHYKVERIVAKIMNPGECIETAINMALEEGAPHIFVETVAYQQTLKWHIEEALRNMQGDSIIEVHELTPKRRNKTARIRTWVKELLAGTYSIGDAVRNLIMFQALAFKLDRTDNKDDILDVNAYGLDVRSDYAELILSSYGLDNMVQLPWDPSAACVQDNNSCLDHNRG